MEDLQTRDQIIACASQLFFTYGIEKTPVQRIIDTVGIAKGTFYHHFKSKEDLLEKVLDELTVKVLSETAGILEKSYLSAREKLMLLFSKSASLKMENMKQTIVLLRHMLANSDKSFRELMQATASEKVVPLFAQILTEGKADGSMNITYPEVTARMLVSLFMGISKEASELVLQAAEGDDAALDKVLMLYRASEEGMERLLGLEPGMLPVFGVDEFLQKIKEVRNDTGA